MTVSQENPDNSPIAASPEPITSVDRFLDRELSWLAFNQRVLELAARKSSQSSPAI